LKTVASPARSGGYTWRQTSTKSEILSQKIKLVEFLAITCPRGATPAIFAARWRGDNFQNNGTTMASKKSLV